VLPGSIVVEETSSQSSPSAGSEMMSRLGLLFGAEARNSSSPSSGRGSATLMSARSQDSSSSMKSLDVPANRVTSSNASPVSTLTGIFFFSNSFEILGFSRHYVVLYSITNRIV
jgi:hypothetical protein